MLNLASRDRHTALSPTSAWVALALAGLLPLLWATPAQAAKPKAKSDLVQATLLADTDVAVRGTTFALGVRLTIKPGWHTYWVNPGEAGQATKVTLTGPPAAFTFGLIQWPLPTRLEHDGTVTYGYENEVLLLVPVTVAKDAPAHRTGSVLGPAKIEADVTWLSCRNEACVEGSAALSLDLPIGPTAKPANAELFDTWRERLPATDLAAAAVKGVDQPTDAGTPAATLTVRWAEPPRKVEWFPVATEAVAIGDIAVNHDGKSTTTITFTPRVYNADGIPGNRVDSLLVYEDAKGVRRGVPVPFAIANPGAGKAK